MKSKDQNKYNAFFKENSSSGEEEVFDRLIKSKKIVERNSMTISFSSDLSHLPVDKTEKEATPEVIKQVNPNPPVSSIPVESTPSNSEEKIERNSNFEAEEQANIEQEVDKEKWKSVPVIKAPSSTKDQPTINREHPQEASPIHQKKTNNIQAPLSKQPNKSTTQVEQGQMDVLNQSASSSINGGSSAQQVAEMPYEVHAKDTPYEEEPIEGKNLIPRSQEVHDILSYVPSWMVRWGNTVILLILVGMLVMSYHIKYPDVVDGMIIINSANPPVPLVAKATGPVTLFKEDRATVLLDEPIGIIKNTASYQDVMNLKSIFIDFQDKLDKGWSFSFYELPKGLQLGELQSAYSQLFLKLKEQRIQHQASKNNTTRKENINQHLTELTTIQKAKEKSLSIKYQEYLKAKSLLETRYKVLYEKGSISAAQLNSKESELRNLLDLYQNDRMTFNEIKKRKLDLNSNKSELDFQKKDQQILSQSSLITAFEELKTAIYRWEANYVLKAPIAGTLNFIRFTKNDMYLQQEQPIANIIPTMDTQEEVYMIGELIIPSVGSGKVAIGQEVNVELNDYPKKQYGIVLGKVESVSNMTISVPEENGMAGYKVMISFPNGLENTLKKEMQFKHNMQGRAEIITADIRLIERFFHELRDLVGSN